MLTTDPLYFRPLLPVITIKNTANNATQYTYNSFTDSGTTDKALYSSVNLSQNTHGEFVVQFEDQNKSLESTVTVGSRVQIDCGKQSSSLTRLISGLVRKKGYARGANNKILYTISGTSTGIRLNERITYVVSEAAKLGTGQPDTSDASRKADTLLASSLSGMTGDGILSIANLAANSDVETFIPSLAIEFGEVQDLVNYIEDQSGGEVIIDTNDLVNFRHEIKNNLFGRGFTIMNSNTNRANHDADDTMYLEGKNWTYEDDFYKSSNYANRLWSILSAETVPSTREELGFDATEQTQEIGIANEFAFKLRPTHSHFLPGDVIMVGSQLTSSSPANPWITRLRIAGPEINTGSASNTRNLPVVVNIDFLKEVFDSPLPVNVSGIAPSESYKVMQDQIFYNSSNVRIDSFDLSTANDYWFILSNDNMPADGLFAIAAQSATSADYIFNSQSAGYSTNSNSGTSWLLPPAQSSNIFCIFLPRRRSQSFYIHDPKAIQALQSGLTAGLVTESVLSNLSPQIKSKDSMIRHLATQLYSTARPRTVYNFSRVTAPNIPPFPGDPIVISDDILGFSTSGNQVVLTTCGDMSYQWGNMGSGSYEAPTRLNIQAVGIHPRYN